MTLKLRKITKPGSSFNAYSVPQQNREIVDDATDIKLSHSRDIKLEAAKRNVQRKIAINKTQGEKIYYFRKLTSGRRCSCFSGFTTPDGKCPICFKTGIVGGFSKFGTNSNIFDATALEYAMVGVHLTFEKQLRPLNFELDDDTKVGEIFFTFDILQTNTNEIDASQFLYSGTGRNAEVKLYVKRQTESTYVLGTTEAIESRLDEDKLDFKIRISRAHPKVASPMLSHLLLRYKLRDTIDFEVDIASNEESTTLDELGYYRNFTTVQSFWDSRVVTMASQDFLYRTTRNQRWKPIGLTDRRNVDITTHFEVTLRLIQDFEPYSRFPV